MRYFKVGIFLPTAKDIGTGKAAATEEANTAVLVASTRGATAIS